MTTDIVRPREESAADRWVRFHPIRTGRLCRVAARSRRRGQILRGMEVETKKGLTCELAGIAEE